MATEAITAAVERGEKFDAFIEAAIRERYRGGADSVLSATPTFDTVPFVDALRTAGCPPDRIPRLVAMLNDLKLQHYFLLVEVLSLYPTDVATPAARLREAAVDQTYIVMTRIFFERFMNLVYYLERGEELKGRSRQRAFFTMVRGSDRWGWIEGFKALIERYDQSYRTPEVHSGSVLRGQLERGVRSVFWRTVAPQNLVYALFTEVEGVLRGRTAHPATVVSCVVSDYMVEGHWQYVPPWDQEEADWRETLFRIAPLEPEPAPEEEPNDGRQPDPRPGPMPIRRHVEMWVAGPGHVSNPEPDDTADLPGRDQAE